MLTLVVRRGAERRFRKLKQETDPLPVEIIWDRRQTDRRAGDGAVQADNRRAERRQTPPFTWVMADFIVITEDDHEAE